VYGQIWPVQNVHVHSQPLLSFLRLAGVEPTAGGVRIAPVFPFDEWSIASPGFGVEYAARSASGWMRALGDAIELRVRPPAALAGEDVRVTASAASVEHDLADGDVVIRLAGASSDRWEWRIEPV
jgi:hypothetical protein